LQPSGDSVACENDKRNAFLKQRARTALAVAARQD
jgi:hypothetical protein